MQNCPYAYLLDGPYIPMALFKVSGVLKIS